MVRRLPLRLLGVASTLTLLTPVGSAAAVATYLTQYASCSVVLNQVTYSGNNRLIYHNEGGRYRLDEVDYRFGPASGDSFHNNDNLYFWGGSKSWTWNSPDNLIRDNTWRALINLYPREIYGQIGFSYMRFQDIFDVPNVADPSCYAYTATF